MVHRWPPPPPHPFPVNVRLLMSDIQLYTETITTKGTLMLREEDRSRTERKEFIRAVKGRKSKAPKSQAQLALNLTGMG